MPTRAMARTIPLVPVVDSTLTVSIEVPLTQIPADESVLAHTDVPPVITSGMAVCEVFQHLIEHGCPDVTSTLRPVPVGCQGFAPAAGGRFGDVYKWTNTSDSVVGVKCLRLHTLSDSRDKVIKQAARELYYWSKAKHRNVLELSGAAMFNGQLAMVSPWMGNGSLQRYMERYPTASSHRWAMCLQIADGLAYIHRIGMVHGDLKAANILVSDDDTLKISDFGNSILEGYSLGFTSTREIGGGSLRWMAFELVGEDMSVERSTMTDVHSLGMTLLEVLTGRVPYWEHKRDVQVILALASGKIPIRPEELSEQDARGEERWNLLTSCWNSEPTLRPTSQVVFDHMNGLSHKSRWINVVGWA